MKFSTDLKHLKPGQEITDFFVIRKKEVRTKRSDGFPYLALELGNSTGRICATIWEDIKESTDEFQVGSLIKVLGKVIDYKGSHSLVIEKIRNVREEDRIKPSDFLPIPKRKIKELRTELRSILQSIQDPHLKSLINSIFSNRDFFKSFEYAPAGKLWHHNRNSGLIEHTLSVVSICDFLAQKYPSINRDMLLCGALLHDVGKIQSYQTDQGFIDYTDEGRLIGHLSIGLNWINQIIEDTPDFPEEYYKQLSHMILSHHGKLENGSPVVPMTIEALILHYADELDSKIDAYLRISEGENADDKKWSNYVRLLDQFFYFPPKLEDQEIENDE